MTNLLSKITFTKNVLVNSVMALALTFILSTWCALLIDLMNNVLTQGGNF